MSRWHVGGQGTRHRIGIAIRAEPELSLGQHQNQANKSQGGACHGQGGGHSRPSKEQSERQHETTGVAGINAGQGNGVTDDVVEGRTRSDQRVRQRAERVDGKCQGKAEGGGQMVCDGAEGRARQGSARQGKAGKGKGLGGTGQGNSGLGRAGKGKARQGRVWGWAR